MADDFQSGIDRYFDTLDAPEQGIQPPVNDNSAPSPGSLDGYFDSLDQEEQDDKRTILKASLYGGIDKPQNVAGEDYELARKYGLPVDTVGRNRERVRKDAKLQDFDGLIDNIITGAPTLSEQMTDPAKAAIFKDDVQPLSDLEGQYRNSPSVKAQREGENRTLISRVVQDVQQYSRKGWQSTDLADAILIKALNGGSEEGLSNDQWLMYKRYKQEPIQDLDLPFAAQAPGAIAESGAQFADMMRNSVALPAATLAGGAAVGAGTGFAVGGPAGAVAGAGTGFVRSVPLAGRAFNLSMLFNGFKVETAFAYDEFAELVDDNGVPIENEVALGAAVLTGIINMIPEYIGDVTIVGSFPGLPTFLRYAKGKAGKESIKEAAKEVIKKGGQSEVLRDLGKSFAKGFTVEGGTEWVQEGTNVLFGELAKMASDGQFDEVFGGEDVEKQRQFLSDALERMNVAALRGGVGGGTISATGTAVSRGAEKVQSLIPDVKTLNEKFKGEQEELKNRTDTVRSAKAAAASPTAFREFLEGLDNHNIYLDSEGMLEFFQSDDGTQFNRLKELIPEIGEQFEQAIGSGSDFVLPASKVDYLFSQTQDFDGLRDYMKFSPDAVLDRDVLEENPELLDMVPSAEENEQLSRLNALEDRLAEEIHRSDLRNTREQAGAYAYYVRQAYENLMGRAINAPSVQRVIERNLGEGLSVRGAQPFVRDSLGLGNLIVKAKAKLRAEEQKRLKSRTVETDLAGAKPKKARKRRGPSPVMDFLSARGKIKTGSVVARELSKMDITPKTYPKLFAKDGAITDVDNIPASELLASLSDVGIDIAEDGNGYVDRQFILDQLSEESFGRGAMNAEQRAAAEAERQLDEFMRYAEGLGIDIGTASPAEIRAAIDRSLNEPDGGQTMFQQAPPVESEAFKKWFGDSKVVDENGDPLVVYHGTTRANSVGFVSDFEAFRPFSHFGSIEAANERLSQQSKRRVLEGSRVIPVYLSIKNPLQIEDHGRGHTVSDFVVDLEDRGILTKEQADSILDKSDETARSYALLEAMRATDYDGFVYDNLVEGAGTKSYVAFRPEQVKSVFNRGTFDANDPRILYQSSVSEVDEGNIRLYRGLEQPFKSDYNLSSTDAPQGYSTWTDNPKLAREYAGQNGYVYYIDLPKSELGQEIVDQDGERPLFIDNEKPAGLRGVSGKEYILNTAHELYNAKNIKEFSETYYQRNQDGKRGSVTFLPDQTTVRLFENADRSTFLHETGHIFLNVLRYAGEAPDTTEQFAQDWQNVRSWWRENSGAVFKEALRYNPYQVRRNAAGYYEVVFRGRPLEQVYDSRKAAKEYADGIHGQMKADLEQRGGEAYVRSFLESGNMQSMDDVDNMILTALDEQFARGFEAYLMEGKAPSVEMKGVFRRFKAWLVNIYRSLAVLDVKLNDDIRGVFDRLLASDDAIEAARTLPNVKPDPAVASILTKEQFAQYMKRKESQVENAKERTFRRALRDASRETKEWWKKEKAAVMEELRRKYTDDPGYRALSFLQKGEYPDGTRPAMEPFKISTDSVIRDFGQEIADKMPKGTMRQADGIDVVAAADLLDYPDADALVKTLSAIEDMETKIEREAKQVMVERHGDVLMNGQIEELAVSHLLSSEAVELLEMEGKAASKIIRAQFARAADFERAADKALARMNVKDAEKPARYFNASIRLARASGKHLQAKNYENYAEAKRREMFAVQMFRKTRDFKVEKEKALRLFGRVNRKQKKGKWTVDAEYHQMAWSILAKFGLGPEGAVPVTFDQVQAWVNGSPNAPGVNENHSAQVFIPEAAASAFGKSTIASMTVDEFRAVRDLVTNIIEQGRKNRTFILDGERLEYQKVRNQAVEKINALPSQQDQYRSQSDVERVVDRYLGIQFQVQTFLALADKGDPDGYLTRVLMDPVRQANKKEREMNHAIATALPEIFKKYYSKSEMREMASLFSKTVDKKVKKSRLIDVNGKKFTKGEMIVALLNMGNEGNIEALTFGENWSDADLEVFLSKFDKRDFDFAQAVWDYLETFWPEIEKLEVRRNGFAPKRVAPKALETRFGTYRGGYYPVRFDPNKSQRVREMDTEREMKGAIGYASTQTRRDHTIERKGVSKRGEQPLLLDFSVLTRHLAMVSHDLAMSEAISQTGRLIKDKAFMEAYTSRFGPVAYEQLRLWILDQAAGNIGNSDIISKASNWARSNMTVAAMGLSATTVLTQISGLATSVVGLGGGAKGMRALGIGFRRQTEAIAKGNYEKLLQEINGKSSIMADRVQNMTRDISDVNELWRKDPLNKTRTQGMLLMPIGWMQKHAVDVATWLAGYEQALENGKTEKEAARIADNIVIKYQGSGLKQDMSGVLRGSVSANTRQSALVKMFTFALSYFNNKLNRVYERTKLADFATFSGRYEWARDMIFLLWMDALIADLILDRLPSGEYDESWQDGWWWWLVQQPASMLVFGRELAAKMTGYPSDIPLFSVMGSAANFATQVSQGEMDKALLRSGVSVAGSTTGVIPSVQLNRTINLMDRISEGQDIQYKDVVRGRYANERD